MTGPFRFTLLLISAWAVVEVFLVWQRQPAPPPPLLPQQMQFEGRWFERQPDTPAVAALPDGVVLQSGADYTDAPSRSRLLLRWLAFSSSGGSVAIDPNQLAHSLMGPSAHGVCRIHDSRTGDLLGVAATGSEALALFRRNDPTGLDTLSWALGLRPWRVNRCLFVGVQQQP